MELRTQQTLSPLNYFGQDTSSRQQETKPGVYEGAETMGP